MGYNDHIFGKRTAPDLRSGHSPNGGLTLTHSPLEQPQGGHYTTGGEIQANECRAFDRGNWALEAIRPVVVLSCIPPPSLP